MPEHEQHAMTPAQALRLVKEAEEMRREEIAALRNERLAFLVAYARKLSPFLAEKYAGLPRDFRLTDIPPTFRSEATARFEDWVCDRDVTMGGVTRFLSDTDNYDKAYLDRYRVLTTSGTTDVPLVMLRDDRHNMVNAALMASRFFGGGKLGAIPRLTEIGCRSAGIMTGGGFHSSYLSFLRMKRAYEAKGLGDNLLALAVDTPLAEKVAKLNTFQPELLVGYPSSLQVLAYARREGRLAISPLAICCSAEHLSDAVLHLLEDSFHCPVMDNYCSTEAGEVAMLCPENHMHVNDDWIIVEPVDADNRPVADGVLSDATLITNLANLVQPVIRYRLSDRIAMHRDPCPCGLPFPYISIEGRKEDILDFEGVNGRVLLSPIIFILLTMHIDGCLSGQFIQRSPASLEIRYEAEMSARPRVGEDLRQGTLRTLAENGAGNVQVRISDEPLIVGKSGKIRYTIQSFE